MLSAADRTASGFTLLEVLIALAIFALVAITLHGRIADVVIQHRHLKDRSVATWVAQNRLTEILYLEKVPGEPLTGGSRIDQVSLSGREWRVETRISTTDNPLIQRVEVEVFDAAAENELAALTGFSGLH